MKLNPEQRLIVYIALLWAYENKEEGVATYDGSHMGLGFGLHSLLGCDCENVRLEEMDLLLAETFNIPFDESGRLSRISLLEKAIEETARKIWG